MVFHPIVHTRTAQAIVERFENLILDGVLRPGDKLPPERQLALDLDVSRPILRDALATLEGANLLVTKRGEGTFVASLIGEVFSPPVTKLMQTSPRAMEDYMEFRRMQEVDMAAMAAQRATSSDREMLAALGEAMRDAHAKGEIEREAELDLELHTLIVEAAHNVVFLHVLRACYTVLANEVFRNRQRLYDQPGQREALLDQHLGLIEAIVEGDTEAARTRASAHIDYVSVASNHLDASDAREATSALRRNLRLIKAV